MPNTKPETTVARHASEGQKWSRGRWWSLASRSRFTGYWTLRRRRSRRHRDARSGSGSSAYIKARTAIKLPEISDQASRRSSFPIIPRSTFRGWSAAVCANKGRTTRIRAHPRFPLPRVCVRHLKSDHIPLYVLDNVKSDWAESSFITGRCNMQLQDRPPHASHTIVH